MKVLVACEYSGAVRDAFLKRGHDAMSCDLLPTDARGPHYQGDVFDIINDGWDLMIAPRHAHIWPSAAPAGSKTNKSRKRKRWTLFASCLTRLFSASPSRIR